MDKREKKKYILIGIKYSARYSLIAAVVVAVIATIISLFKGTDLFKNIFMGLYYFGGFSLIFTLPFFFKRNEDAKLKKIRHMSPLFGFYDIFNNPYSDKAMIESFEQFRGDGFLNGMFMLLFSLIIFFIAFILENLYYMGGY